VEESGISFSTTSVLNDELCKVSQAMDHEELGNRNNQEYAILVSEVRK